MPYSKRLTGSKPEFPVDIVDDESGFAMLYFNDTGKTIQTPSVLGRLYIHNKQANTYEWRNVHTEAIGSTVKCICNFAEDQYGSRMYIELGGLQGSNMMLVKSKSTSIVGSTVVSGMCEIVAGEFDW